MSRLSGNGLPNGTTLSPRATDPGARRRAAQARPAGASRPTRGPFRHARPPFRYPGRGTPCETPDAAWLRRPSSTWGAFRRSPYGGRPHAKCPRHPEPGLLCDKLIACEVHGPLATSGENDEENDEGGPLERADACAGR